MKDYDILKKYYGEKFARLCRTLFPTLLEIEGLVSKTILSKFEPSKFLYEDIVENDYQDKFRNYIYGVADVQNETLPKATGTPEELFDKAGYKLFKCETNDDVQSFKKYYNEYEELCTFADQRRIDNHTIFFAVKKNVDKIKREDFPFPIRQDEYGTSVISIQFTKGKNSYLSIKNRYNHTVSNPDATFSNNLEEIYPGLTDSFRKYYGINQIRRPEFFYLPNYVYARGKFYKYNCKILGEYYCPNNIIIDRGRNIIRLDSDKEELIDYFIFNKQNKTVKAGLYNYDDAFIDSVKDIEKIYVKKIEYNQKIMEIILKNGEKTELLIDKNNRIIKYTNNHIKNVGDNFLSFVMYMKEFNAANLEKTGNYFLYSDEKLTDFNARNVKEFGENCLSNNESLENIDLSNTENIGGYFLYRNEKIKKFIAKKLRSIGECCLTYDKLLSEVDVENLEEIGILTFGYWDKIKVFNAPKLNKNKVPSNIKKIMKNQKGISVLKNLIGVKNKKQEKQEENNF